MTYNNKHTGEEKVNQGYSRREWMQLKCRLIPKSSSRTFPNGKI